MLFITNLRNKKKNSDEETNMSIVREGVEVVKQIGKGMADVRHYIKGKRPRSSSSSSPSKKSKSSNKKRTANMGDTERKYKQNSTGAIYCNSTGDLFLLNGISEGTGGNERVGRVLNLDTISLRIAGSSPSGFGNTFYRVMVVYDSQCNGTALTVGALLTTPANPHLSFYDLGNRDRFRVIYDGRFASNAIGGGTTRYTIRGIGRKIDQLKTVYSDSGNTVAAIATGSLYLVVLGTPAVGDDNAVKQYLSIDWRLRYYDQ